MPAPIMMTSYRRLEHVKQTVEALRRNRLAPQSELFVTSDGPRKGHEEEVMAVRDFLRTVDGFRQVHLLFREENDIFGNWEVRSNILKEHGRLVFLEEDCVTTPGFLDFINQGLERHADDRGIFSIAGYAPPVPQLASDTLRCAKVRSFIPWGFGIWEDRNKMVERKIPPEEFNRLVADRGFRKRVLGSLGPRYFGMLRNHTLGKIRAYDLMAMLAVIRNDMTSIFPSQSFVRNIGFDGSGAHCGETGVYDVQPHTGGEFRFSELPCIDSDEINRGFAKFFGGGYRDRIKFTGKRLRGRMRIPES